MDDDKSRGLSVGDPLMQSMRARLIERAPMLPPKTSSTCASVAMPRRARASARDSLPSDRDTG
jgi:hypothetical protein